MNLTPEMATWVLQITGATQLIKNFLPENVKAKMRWWVIALIPVIAGAGLHFVDPSISLQNGVIAGILTALGYKAHTTTMTKVYKGK